MQGQVFGKRLNLAYGDDPLMRIGKLQCGTIRPYRFKKGSNQQNIDVEISASFDEIQTKRVLWRAPARCKSKANCALLHCTDLNLSAILGTPSRASEAHDWGNFYNSARIHLHEIRIHGRGRVLILSPNIE